MSGVRYLLNDVIEGWAALMAGQLANRYYFLIAVELFHDL
jgi:hypothetical protein